MTRTAVRGIETAAGRVAGIVTEHGRVTTRAVVCAAGAWSRLFCGSLGIRVPQLPVLNSVARLPPGPELLAGQAWSPAVAIRRRADGGYTVAHGHTSIHSIVPASFREAFKFLPAFRTGHGSTRLRIGADLFRALGVPARWPLDRETPSSASASSTQGRTRVCCARCERPSVDGCRSLPRCPSSRPGVA